VPKWLSYTAGRKALPLSKPQHASLMHVKAIFLGGESAEACQGNQATTGLTCEVEEVTESTGGRLVGGGIGACGPFHGTERPSCCSTTATRRIEEPYWLAYYPYDCSLSNPLGRRRTPPSLNRRHAGISGTTCRRCFARGSPTPNHPL